LDGEAGIIWRVLRMYTQFLQRTEVFFRSATALEDHQGLTQGVPQQWFMNDKPSLIDGEFSGQSRTIVLPRTEIQPILEEEEVRLAP
jgi:hypothetical protein